VVTERISLFRVQESNRLQVSVIAAMLLNFCEEVARNLDDAVLGTDATLRDRIGLGLRWYVIDRSQRLGERGWHGNRGKTWWRVNDDDDAS